MKTIAILPAAGLGLRMNAKEPKQYLALKGETILHWTLAHLSASPLIDGICLVLSKNKLSLFDLNPQSRSGQNCGGVNPSPLRKSGAVPLPTVHLETVDSNQREVEVAFRDKLKWIVPGGNERQFSVANGFKAIPECEVVLVHDAVRPFVPNLMIEQLIQTAKDKGAAIPALPLKETIKEVEDGVVKQSADRSKLWSVQTPQAFGYHILKEAIALSEKDAFVGTDESMLVERMGGKVSVVQGSPYNIKITQPEDLGLAERIFDENWNRV